MNGQIVPVVADRHSISVCHGRCRHVCGDGAWASLHILCVLCACNHCLLDTGPHTYTHRCVYTHRRTGAPLASLLHTQAGTTNDQHVACLWSQDSKQPS